MVLKFFDNFAQFGFGMTDTCQVGITEKPNSPAAESRI